ncbi:MAG: restriction endonuclease subunit S, partial [Magnetococcales bacterium]|nr:restriction endonuclease subunit S [Magnetococcales bacterium]
MAHPPELDLRPKHLAEVRRLIHDHLPDAEVWAFGSRVTGTAFEGSDLDLVARHPSQTNIEQPPEFFDLKEAFTESNLPFLVDLHDWARIPESFHRNIEEKYVVVQEGKSGTLEKVGESDLPFKVDVVDWATTAEGFRRIIEKGRVVVQKRNESATLPNGTTPPRGLPVDLILWPLLPARDLFDLKYGKALIESNRQAGDVPVYGTNGQCGTHNEPLFAGPGIIIGRKGQGPLGVEWCGCDYWVIDTAYALSPKRPGIDLRYAYFLIKYIGLNHLKDGTSNPTLSRDTFGSQALPIPPLHHQRAIAQVLGALDDKIELNRRMNADLDAMVRALFKDWFVDFGPVRAKAEGRPAYFVQEIWDLFPDALDDEDKPVGWKNGKLGDYFEAIKGVPPHLNVDEQNFVDFRYFRHILTK